MPSSTATDAMSLKTLAIEPVSLGPNPSKSASRVAR
jgi:hypothetical protein